MFVSLLSKMLILYTPHFPYDTTKNTFFQENYNYLDEKQEKNGLLKGWWAGKGRKGSGEFRKRGTQNITSFCGWNRLLNLLNGCGTWIEKGLIGALFETGGRASEVLTLTADQFVDQGEYVEVLGMRVLKQSEEEYKQRNVPMLKSEPMLPPLMNWVEDIRDGGGGRLFPYKYDWLYKRVCEIDKDWWPHRFRAERASQLARDKNFRIAELMRFFGWKTEVIAVKYVRLSVKDLVQKMSRGEV